MKRYIEWNMNYDTRYSPEDPLGDIIIFGDEGKIEEKNIFIDTFFESLVNCVNKISKSNKVVSDLIDEPYNIVIINDNNRMVLELGDQVALIEDVDVFIDEIRHSVKNIINMLDDYCYLLNKDPLQLSLLRNYLLT